MSYPLRDFYISVNATYKLILVQVKISTDSLNCSYHYIDRGEAFSVKEIVVQPCRIPNGDMGAIYGSYYRGKFSDGIKSLCFFSEFISLRPFDVPKKIQWQIQWQ